MLWSVLQWYCYSAYHACKAHPERTDTLHFPSPAHASSAKGHLQLLRIRMLFLPSKGRNVQKHRVPFSGKRGFLSWAPNININQRFICLLLLSVENSIDPYRLSRFFKIIETCRVHKISPSYLVTRIIVMLT